MHTVDITKARMMVKGADGEWITLAPPTEDHFFVGVGDELNNPTMSMPRCVLTIHKNTASAEALLDLYADTEGRKEFPIVVTRKAHAPKQRRHTRGGLRRMVAARTHKFTAHGISVATEAGELGRGSPWVFSMPVTKAAR